MYDWVAHFPFAAGLRFTAKVGELSRQRNLGLLAERPSHADFVMGMYFSFSGFWNLKQLCYNARQTVMLCIALRSDRSYLGFPTLKDKGVTPVSRPSCPHGLSFFLNSDWPPL